METRDLRWRTTLVGNVVLSPRLRSLFVKSLNPACQLDRQRVSLAVHLLSHGYLDPAFTDAVFGNVGALLVVEADADVVLKNGGHVVRAFCVGGQAVGQRWSVSGVGHRWFDIKDCVKPVASDCRLLACRRQFLRKRSVEEDP